MLLKAFTIYDTKAEAYLRPFFFNASGEAVRAFSDTCNDEENNIGLHPADYQLFEIGTFDEATGVLEPKNERINLGNGLEFVEGSKQLREIKS